MELDAAITAAVKLAITQAGWTLHALAYQLGVSHFDLLARLDGLTIDFAMDIARVLGVRSVWAILPKVSAVL